MHKLAKQINISTSGAVVFFHSPTRRNYLRTKSPGRNGHSGNWLIHYTKSNCLIQNQIVLFKIKLRYAKSNCVDQNQIVLCKIRLCYSKSNCVMQNQIVLFKIKLCYAKSDCVIQSQIVLSNSRDIKWVLEQ